METVRLQPEVSDAFEAMAGRGFIDGAKRQSRKVVERSALALALKASTLSWFSSMLMSLRLPMQKDILTTRRLICPVNATAHLLRQQRINCAKFFSAGLARAVDPRSW